jgi:hypothetical protein
VGRNPPGPAEQRPTGLEPASDASETAPAENGMFASPSSMPVRARRRVRGADTRGSLPGALKSNVELGLALFTASTALHCARLDLLAGDLATAEEELGRAYDAVAGSEEECLLPPIAEMLAEVVHAQGRDHEAGKIPRAAEGLALGDRVELEALGSTVRRSALDWRGRADEAEWRAREALDLVRIRAALARLSSWPARSASTESERRASERPAGPARQAVAAPGLSREGVLREILANAWGAETRSGEQRRGIVPR